MLPPLRHLKFFFSSLQAGFWPHHVIKTLIVRIAKDLQAAKSQDHFSVLRLIGHALLLCFPTILLVTISLFPLLTPPFLLNLQMFVCLGAQSQAVFHSLHLLSRESHAFWCVLSSLAALASQISTHCSALCLGKSRTDSGKWHYPAFLISCLLGRFGQWEAPARWLKGKKGSWDISSSHFLPAPEWGSGYGCALLHLLRDISNFIGTSVFISYSCCNELPQTGWLKAHP